MARQAKHVPLKKTGQGTPSGSGRNPGGSAAVKAKRDRFIVAYLQDEDGNATRAAMIAGVPAAAAKQWGAKALQHPYVQQLIGDHRERMAAELEAKYALTRENVLSALANLVHADPRKLFHDDGRLRHVTELDDRTAKMVSSFEVEELYEMEGEGRNRSKVNVGRVTKIRMWDKNSAVDKAMRHLGLYEKDNEQTRDTKLVITEKDAGVL